MFQYIHVLVEGDTEEKFVKDMLNPHFERLDLHLTPIKVTTRHKAGEPKFKGGVRNYGKVKADLQRLLRDSHSVLVTTMLDFYGLPKDFPGRQNVLQGLSCYDQVVHFEQAFATDIDDRRFLPYLALHEFEAMLFTEPSKIAARFPDHDRLEALQSIRDQVTSPEEIDDSPATAPSKRILALLPQYRKPTDGYIICQSIGIDRIRAECPRFNQWLKKLENLSEGEKL